MDIHIKACERQAFLLAHRLRNEKKKIKRWIVVIFSNDPLKRTKINPERVAELYKESRNKRHFITPWLFYSSPNSIGAFITQVASLSTGTAHFNVETPILQLASLLVLFYLKVWQHFHIFIIGRILVYLLSLNSFFFVTRRDERPMWF